MHMDLLDDPFFGPTRDYGIQKRIDAAIGRLPERHVPRREKIGGLILRAHMYAGHAGLLLRRALLGLSPKSW